MDSDRLANEEQDEEEAWAHCVGMVLNQDTPRERNVGDGNCADQSQETRKFIRCNIFESPCWASCCCVGAHSRRRPRKLSCRPLNPGSMPSPPIPPPWDL